MDSFSTTNGYIFHHRLHFYIYDMLHAIHNATHPAGLLQNLVNPDKIWEGISMDFVEALPKVAGNLVILRVVDRL